MIDDATILTRLCGAVEQQLSRGHALGYDTKELWHATCEAWSRPCEGERMVDDEACMLVTALKRIQIAQADADANEKMKWEMIAGVLLPCVRRARLRAIETRRRNTVPL